MQPHDIAGAGTMFQPIKVCSPRRQCVRLLGTEIVPVIDSRHAGDHAAAVVQNRFQRRAAQYLVPPCRWQPIDANHAR